MSFILIAVVVSLGAAVQAPAQPPQASAQRHFADEGSCERAASLAAPPLGKKLVCVSAEDANTTPSAV